MVQSIFEAGFHILQKHLWRKMEGPPHIKNKRTRPKTAWPQAQLVNNEHVIWTWALASDRTLALFIILPAVRDGRPLGRDGAFPSTGYNLCFAKFCSPGGTVAYLY